MSVDPLRRLLDELHRAERDRAAAPRDSAEYDRAVERVEQVARAVWDWPPDGHAPPAGDQEAGRD